MLVATAAALTTLLAALTPAVGVVHPVHEAADYTITTWDKKSGLPSGNIRALAQDADGYLWLGLVQGLARFDGVRFVTWNAISPTPLPQLQIQSLCVASDGNLWIGFGGGVGGLGRVEHNRAQYFKDRAGTPFGEIRALAEDHVRTMWAGGPMGLYRLDASAGASWQPEEGLPDSEVYGLSVDSHGTLLVAAGRGLFRRVAQNTFERVVGVDGPVAWVSEDQDGALWVTNQFTGFKRAEKGWQLTGQFPRGIGRRLLHDGKNQLWVATSQGLWLARSGIASHGGHEEVSVITDLVTDSATPLLEDRQNNVWTGTPDMLVRFSPRRFTRISTPSPVLGLEVGASDSVWVATADALLRFSNADGAWRKTQTYLEGSRIRALHIDGHGMLWVASEHGVSRAAGDARAGPRPFFENLRDVDLITSTPNGQVWFHDAARGLFSWNGARLDAIQVPELDTVRITSIFGDREDRVWMTFGQARVAVMNRDRTVHIYRPEDGLGHGEYRTFFEDHDNHLWIGSTAGLSQFTRGRFVTESPATGFPTETVIAIIEDRRHQLWLGNQGVQPGIIRLNPSVFDHPPASRTAVPYMLYDRSDGVAGAPRWYGNRNSIETDDGLLWFMTNLGITIVDPDRLAGPRALPRLDIDEISIDNNILHSDSGSVLPPDANKLAISYTAPDLESATRVRFRYRLDGFDKRWIDANASRQAVYANLLPRSYVFHVQAKNDDGQWVEPGAVWSFSVAPRFYQTSWFLGGSLVLVVCAAWSAWRLRDAQIRRTFAILLAERVRISRDIHDTLLQSLVGLALQLDAVAADIPDVAGRTRLVRMRRNVEAHLREARQSILNLRSPMLEQGDLATALRHAGEYASDHAVDFVFTVQGTPQRCPDAIAGQLLRVGQEAVWNSLRHAQARRISMELLFATATITLSITDDGRGFDQTSLREDNGHLGLISMRERIETVGGELHIAGETGHGTTIKAIVPLPFAHSDSAPS